MFQLIKILVEKVIGQISFESISKHRKEKQLAKIGTELMLLYMSLNSVLVVGERILDQLREIAKGEDSAGFSVRVSALRTLHALLKEQAGQIVKVIGSCYRLRVELGVVDENGGRVLARLIDIKIGLLRNQICELWPEIWSRRSGTSQLIEHDELLFLRSFNEESVDRLLALETHDWYETDRDMLRTLWNSGVQMPLDDPGPGDPAERLLNQPHRDLAQRFLDSGAGENLEAIAGCVQQLRHQIEKTFSMKDILLEVRDPRFSEHPNAVLWRAGTDHRLRSKH
jgi:hypothetical protein